MEFEETYNQVFDKNGNIKACGREKTKALIILCQNQLPGVDFGNPKTGFMNINNIKHLRRQLFVAN